MGTTNGKVPGRVKYTFAFGALGKDLIYGMMATFAMIYFTDVLKVSPGFVGIVFFVAKLWDAFNDLFMGMIVDDMILKQIKNQLSKLEDVVKIFELENSKSVCRELILAKIRANKTEKQEVITIADIFRAKVVDVSKDNLMIELTGNVNKIEAFINLISDFGVIEIVRTGITGLSRGEDNSNIF